MILPHHVRFTLLDICLASDTDMVIMTGYINLYFDSKYPAFKLTQYYSRIR